MDTEKKPTFYEAVKHIPHDNHESDLYLLWTSEAAELCKQYSMSGKCFVSNLDGKLYIDIPFAYEPWWEARQRVSADTGK
jgi:hypothetical protein